MRLDWPSPTRAPTHSDATLLGMVPALKLALLPSNQTGEHARDTARRFLRHPLRLAHWLVPPHLDRGRRSRSVPSASQRPLTGPRCTGPGITPGLHSNPSARMHLRRLERPLRPPKALRLAHLPCGQLPRLDSPLLRFAISFGALCFPDLPCLVQLQEPSVAASTRTNSPSPAHRGFTPAQLSLHEGIQKTVSLADIGLHAQDAIINPPHHCPRDYCLRALHHYLPRMAREQPHYQ